MSKARYAAFHPGKIGDALYALPLIRYIYGVTGEPLDFYTSDYCEPMRALFEYQPCINSFNIAPGYRIERMDMGCQPPFAILDGYEQVFQLGFRSVPDRAIHQFIAAQEGITIALGVRYEHPKRGPSLPKQRHICIAPRGETSYTALFNDVADILQKQNIQPLIIGGVGDYTGHGIDYTGRNLLETTTILSRAIGFIGLMSSQLVLANGFDIPRIAPHDGRSWDMRHVIYSEFNHYPVNPTADDIMVLLKDVL